MGRANPGVVVLFLSLGGFAFAVLQSMVAPALPDIAAQLHTSSADVSWVVTAYLLAAAVLTPVLGRLGDIAGKRRVLIIVVAVLAVGTLLAAAATTLPVLIFARAVQGTAGAILPLSVGIVRDELPPERVNVSVGLLSAITGIGGGLGIVIAGPIVDHLSWQWLFWLPLLLVVVALAGVVLGVPESPVKDRDSHLDLPGAATLSVTLVALLLAITKGPEWGWVAGPTLALLALAAVALVGFVMVEQRTTSPLVNLPLLAKRNVWATDLVGLIFGFAMFGMFILIPTLLELPAATGFGFGKTVTGAGLFLLPSTVMMLALGPVSGLLADRFGARVPLLLGSVVTTVAFLIPAIAHDQAWQLMACGLLFGAGMGLVLAAMSSAIVAAVPADHTAEAMGVNAIARSIGGSAGTAVVAAVITAHTTTQGIPLDSAFTSGFWVCSIAAAVAIAAVLVISPRSAEGA
ncbi:MFS transporter [Propionicicella superfundia]|uniref:MFS transporter n=1 Tax=Propionicicella superfundia TaxID=348582 RepID=UPI0003F81491|nr:MFS transporter [Propionicicella superfundia]